MVRSAYEGSVAHTWSVEVSESNDRDLFERGSALIVATVDDDGAPVAARGWGMDWTGPRSARLLLDADDVSTVSHATTGGPIAVTAADVATLQSVQVKGRCLGVEPATDHDRRRARRFCDELYDDIHRTDGTPLATLERFTPAGFVVCHLEVHESFDQTPGPGAGAAVEVAP